MAHYRLTTLNLDDETRAILRKQDNQSRYARECILNYAQLVQEMDYMEQQLVTYRRGCRALGQMLQDFYKMYPDDVAMAHFLGEWIDETQFTVSKLAADDYLHTNIIAAIIRRGTF